MSQKVLNQKSTEYQRILEVMTCLLEFDAESKQNISTYVQNVGITTFFREMECFNLNSDIKEAIKDLRTLINVFERSDPNNKSSICLVFNKERNIHDE